MNMTYNSIKHLSLSISIVFHLILFLLFLIIKVSMDYPVKEYVELSFGQTGETGSSGAVGTKIEEVQQVAKPEEKNETVDNTREVKEVALPEAVNAEDENIITPADESKDEAEAVKNETEDIETSETASEGVGNKAVGEGSFGYDIEWGGKGQRRIYNYTLPAYPEGVEKEINIRLQFSILPDGTVGTIIPRTKADTRLENAAINSLRQWRFEPLSPQQPQVEQTAVIVFPYRLQ